MKIKTSDATPKQIDWLVAKCVALQAGSSYVDTPKGKLFINAPTNPVGRLEAYSPSTDWAQGGPIIERARISVISDYHEIKEGWLAEGYDNSVTEFGSTPLIAAMRCYVASKLGEEIEIPEELA